MHTYIHAYSHTDTYIREPDIVGLLSVNQQIFEMNKFM